MMTVAVQRLNEGVRAALVAHFLALPMKNRCLRFATLLAPRVIAAYVDGIDFGRDAVFGVHDEQSALVGVAHVAFEDDLAELGLSVLPAHRSRGVGGALFNRAVAHVRDRCIPRLFMHCLSGNAPIMRIEQRFGMDIVEGAAAPTPSSSSHRPPWHPSLSRPTNPSGGSLPLQLLHTRS
jgi:GNAT superfamily N-acetyltransferase